MKALKPQLLKLHRWVGLTLAVLLTIQGLSGMSLVFRDEIDRVIHPALVVEPAATRVPVQALMDAVEARHPGVPVSRAEFPLWDDGAVLFKLTAKDGTRWLTAVDPYRGVIVRDGSLAAWPGEWIFLIHDSLLAGPFGETIVGIEGFGLLFLALTGPIVWWPGRKRLKQGFKVITGRGADLKWRTLHRAVGASIAIVLVMSATTGVLMVWKPEFRNVLRIVTPVTDKPAPKVPEQPSATMVPVDRLVAKARAEYGPTELRQIRFSDSGRVAAIFLESDLTIRAEGAKQIYYNRYDGSDVGHYVSGALPVGTEIVDWLITLHTGMFGGTATRLLMVVAGLSLAGLSASGLWLWYSRTTRGRKRAPVTRARAMAESA
ncbi:putative iron-regulated membrane protein [Sphingopyxis sp. OAS728]|uniref:PepSY-associated TM helix domain-containing protein n=1 Tax=Sphingopyxis sp. OAS728 TaxID=2663823 RepID=UPI00178B2B08|nr:PepSY-associated TM helix domain-containing protein [Sphingopyxis sp. OAS728]MBE1529964.1 putative iron-regulated membrane protein [Sphingopyxis sp. OAS728]